MAETISFIIPGEDADNSEFDFSDPECVGSTCEDGVGMCAIFAVIATLLAAKYAFQCLVGIPKIAIFMLVVVGVNVVLGYFSRRGLVDNEPTFSCSIMRQEPEESLEHAEHAAAFLAEQHDDVGELLHKADIAVERLRARDAAADARRELAQMKRILRDHEDAKNTLIELKQTAEALAECRAAIELAKA
jgi:hypothetical protein